MENNIITKICTKCKTKKNTEEFSKDRSKKSGYRYKCKLCETSENKQRRRNKIVIPQNLDDEIWKVIDGYLDYQVSNMGRVKRLAKYKNCQEEIKYFLPEMILNPVLSRGYYVVSLTNNLKNKRAFVHRLVALAFLENPQNLPVAHHIDHNPANNKLDNLMWVTKKQNSDFASKAGRLKKTYRNIRNINHERKVIENILPDYYTNESITLDGEIVKDLNGYKGLYEISNYGRIWSLQFGKKIRKPCFSGTCKTGKPLAIILDKNGEIEQFYLHQLVGINFIPNPQNLPIVNHKDLNKTNNFVGNLEWSTYSNNTLHAIAMGSKWDIGEKSLHAKLTEKEVLEIRRLRHEENISYGKLSKMFGVTKHNIIYIIKGRTWKHLL